MTWTQGWGGGGWRQKYNKKEADKGTVMVESLCIAIVSYRDL